MSDPVRSVEVCLKDPRDGRVVARFSLREDGTAVDAAGHEIEGHHGTDKFGWRTFEPWSHPEHTVGHDFELERLWPHGGSIDEKIALLRSRGHVDDDEESMMRELLDLGSDSGFLTVSPAVLWKRLDFRDPGEALPEPEQVMHDDDDDSA